MAIISHAIMPGGESVASTAHPEKGQEVSPVSKQRVCPKCYKPKQENEWGLHMCRMCEIGGAR